MRVSVWVAAAIIAGVGATAAEAQTVRAKMTVGMVILPSAARAVPDREMGQRLPFRQGTYATDRAACAGMAEGVIAVAAGRVSTAGLSCSIDSVRQRGRDVLFREVCWRDGREVAIQRRWTRLSSSRFSHDGDVFERCTGMVTARR